MKEAFDVAIVGAGPAGTSAACVLADAGIKTIVFERGEYPGSKNISGGVLYGHDLGQILPDFVERNCPVERNVVKSSIWYLSQEAGYSIQYFDNLFRGEKKYNAFTVGRAKFDRWYAEQARKKGALIVPSTVVVDLLRDRKGYVVGVVTERRDGEVRAKVTLLADGVNSPLALRTGFRPELKPQDVALSVKEVLELPSEVIDERFGVSDEDGSTTEVLGEITAGMNGVAILYTNRNSLSLAIGANLADFANSKLRPHDLLEGFKRHPMVAPLIAGGEPREYTAHWLAEGGFDTIPNLYGDGYLIVGDSAMLFNALHREGSNLAIASGRMAAETIIEAMGKEDFSKRSLAFYGDRLNESYVLKDLKKYRRFGRFLQNHKGIFNQLPHLAALAAREILTVDGFSKRDKQRLISKRLHKETSIVGLLKLVWQGWRSIN